MEFPYTSEPIPASEEAVYAAFPSYRQHGLAMFGPDRVVYSADALPILQKLYQTPLHADDLWLLTPPKCGTTWMSELAWLVNHDCDFEAAKSYLVPDRAHFLDMPVIYVVRNPKDAVVSFYKMLQNNKTLSPELTVDQYAELYMADRCISTPFFSNVLQAWKQRNHPNMLFVTFEEMKQDLRGVINRVAAHLGKQLTEKQLEQLERHLSFESMKDNQWVNKENLGYRKTDSSTEESQAFMRKGQTGDWKNNLSTEVAQKMDVWMEENLRGTGMELVTELPKKHHVDVIYVVRNPKDAVVSFYKMLQNNKTLSPELTVDQYAELYMAGRCISTPFFSNVLQAWKQRNHPNMLFVTFEEMKQDLRGVINRVAAHLGKQLTEKQLEQLERHLSFESMKDNQWVNKENLGFRKPDSSTGERRAFMRKGQTGDWKNHLSTEVAQKMDVWMEENLRGTGLELVAELPQK
ncbi:Sulfotransferase family cytosolic 1B member 1 [Amphibalanus amphitrite]|uniref:Sulfotransferase family cytosolic 1B member 1 n=1 Tax=Amphibalanus amphitrite TaxID=1232801 RepID=A0A6A4VQ56_AMPAM|nr:Sulfotransferase family cytosolic 1B member 1 [Amphibalanus amphitrite]